MDVLAIAYSVIALSICALMGLSIYAFNKAADLKEENEDLIAQLNDAFSDMQDMCREDEGLHNNYEHLNGLYEDLKKKHAELLNKPCSHTEAQQSVDTLIQEFEAAGLLNIEIPSKKKFKPVWLGPAKTKKAKNAKSTKRKK
jgi:uncharacterized protein YoxC